MRRREEIPENVYYQDIIKFKHSLSVSRVWHDDLDLQTGPIIDVGELVYNLEDETTLAGVIKFSPSDHISSVKYLFSERMNGVFAHDRVLAIRFGQAALLDFEMSQEYNDDLGAAVDRQDTVGIKTYTELGFIQSGPFNSTDEAVVMLRPGIAYRLAKITKGDD